ncbi:MAG: MgtC/SapB family protein, partial [Aquificota bacterium]
SIKGLTTAASLWTTAGIGLSVGAGMYILSLFSTALLLFTLSLMSRIEKEFMGVPAGQTISLTLEGIEEPLDYLKETFGNVRIRSVERESNLLKVSFETDMSRNELNKSLEKLTKDERVKRFEVS